MIYDILSNRFTAKSFADRAVDPTHIEQLISLLKLVPSKQNVYPYTITMFGYEHKDLKEQLFKLTSVGPPWPNNFNPQVLAPLLLVWSHRPNENAETLKKGISPGHPYDAQFLNSMIEVGISSMSVLTLSHELGYVTGYCRCYQPKETRELLSIDQEIILMLGIGYPSNDSRVGRTRETRFWYDKPNFNEIIQVR